MKEIFLLITTKSDAPHVPADQSEKVHASHLMMEAMFSTGRQQGELLQ